MARGLLHDFGRRLRPLRTRKETCFSIPGFISNPTGESGARFIEFLPPHSVENVGTSEIHLISVELKPR